MSSWGTAVLSSALALIIAVATAVILVPIQQKRVEKDSSKLSISAEMRAQFSHFIRDYEIYKNHMDTEKQIDQSDKLKVNNFLSKYRKLSDRFHQSTRSLSDALARADVFFSKSVRDTISKFRKWHNEQDKVMQYRPTDQWPNKNQYIQWRGKIMIDVRKEIEGWL